MSFADEDEVKQTIENATSEARVNTILAAWDNMIIPPRPIVGYRPEADIRHFEKLEGTIKDFAAKANQHEGVIQSLAQANFRQSKIILKLRADIARLNKEVMDYQLADYNRDK